MQGKAVIIILAMFGGIAGYLGNLSFYEYASISLFIYYALLLLVSMGKSYDLLAIPIVLLIFECLLMPSLVYNVYNDDTLIIALKYSMNTPKDEYFGYMFPATVAMIIGMRVPIISEQKQLVLVKSAIENSKKYLVGKGNLGVLLISVGAGTGVLDAFAPSELNYVLFLFSQLIFVGAFYIYYSDSKNRKLFLIGALSFILLRSVAQGMFGDLVYISLLGGLLIMLGSKIKTHHKVLVAVLGFVVVLLIQSIKADFRAATWYGKSDQGREAAFVTLIVDRITDPSRFFDLAAMFPTVNRFNQGMIVSKIMEYVPQYEPYAEGETIMYSVFSSFVPRILWPDKPKAGGHVNMLRFTGFEVVGYSMNLGVVGEAYANYGVDGGIFFMFVYGLLFNFVFFLILRKSRTTPTIILWVPIIYLNAIQAETDTLMTINSTMKNILFVAFSYWAANKFLRLKL
jgi:hypothetical protein